MSFYYLATPYSKYPDGIEAAYVLACREQARLIKAGIATFCPISHLHGPAMHGDIDPKDHAIWIPADQPFIDMACGLIMLTAASWEESYGMKIELAAFRGAGKPIFWMSPGALPKGFVG